jgi:hypothetical protein
LLADRRQVRALPGFTSALGLMAFGALLLLRR